jgi:hypothetical protein
VFSGAELLIVFLESYPQKIDFSTARAAMLLGAFPLGYATVVLGA